MTNGTAIAPLHALPHQVSSAACTAPKDVKGGVNLDHFGGAKVDQLVKG